MAENKKSGAQEVDLLELFNSIGKGIKLSFLAIFKGCLFLVITGLRKSHYLIAFAILGVLTGFLIFSASKRYYSSYMIAQANGINSSDLVSYINDLHDYCQKNNHAALSNDLQMHDTTAQKIKDIQAFYIIDANRDGIGDYVDFKNSFNPKDTTQERLNDRIHIAVEVLDNTVFEKVKNGLYRYIRVNPFLIQLNEIRKQELRELISQTEKEIQKLDSLQNTDYFKSHQRFASKQSQMMFVAEKEPTMYYKDKMMLTRQKQLYQKELELARNEFTVIKDFTRLAAAENPRGRYLIRYGLIYTIIGYLLLLIYTYRKKISNYAAYKPIN